MKSEREKIGNFRNRQNRKVNLNSQSNKVNKQSMVYRKTKKIHHIENQDARNIKMSSIYLAKHS